MTRADDKHVGTTHEQADVLAHWREQILYHCAEARSAFEHMRSEQRTEWFHICHALAWDDDGVVRTFALRQLAFHGDHDDLEAEAAALDVLKQMPEKVREVTPEYPHRITPQRHLQIAALLALGHIRWSGSVSYPLRSSAGWR